MDIDEPVGRGIPQRRRPRWPYWVFMPTCGLMYAVYCIWFMMEALGRQDEPKPDWFNAAFVFAVPGMFLIPIPFIGALIVGAGAGFILVWLVQQSPRFRSPAPPKW